MRLFEAIVKANKESSNPISSVNFDTAQFKESLPIVILTCIDPRLNKLFPNVLGVSDEEFIWLRNAGNIITGSFSSTIRSLSLACAVKQGKEIAVIGHTDCLIGKSTVLSITEQFKKLGIDRIKLPDNLVEFFGLFASERQNVINATQFIRQSALISSKVPVHGLLLDTNTGKMEWIVNGYETLGAQSTQFSTTLESAATKVQATVGMIQDFQVGSTTVAETKIGEAIEKIGEMASKAKQIIQENPEAATPAELVEKAAIDFTKNIIQEQLYKIIGSDNRLYGPVSGTKIIEWLNDGRITDSTPIQIQGTNGWKTIKDLLESDTSNFPAAPIISETVKRLKGRF